MALVALKIDVDTYRGTREGALRLAALLERLGVRATFLFSLGPDHTGRAIKRVFRRGFLGKVQRTSVLEHYGLKTLLYGVLLPGPHIGRTCRSQMQDIARRGFEVGVHTFDHVRWQDGVSRASEPWTRRELTRAYDEFADIFGRKPQVHGAAGLADERLRAGPAAAARLPLRVRHARHGAVPAAVAEAGAIPQLPTTLPTFDELIGREDLGGADPVQHLLSLTDAAPSRDQVFTLHAELEGGAYLGHFERLLRGWQQRGMNLADLATYAGQVHFKSLPRCAIVAGTVAGRSGTLALQAP